MGGESCCKQRCKRRDGPIHQTGEARLHVLQHKHPSPSLFLLFSCRGSEKLRFELSRATLVSPFGGGEIAEQLSNPHIRRALGRLVVEPSSLKFHILSLL